MQSHTSLDTIDLAVPVALTIGAFDGIHRGHQHLIGQVRAAASRLGGVSAVLTFDPHPDRVLWPDRARLFLTDNVERADLIAALGVDHLIVLPFDRALSQVPAEAFMERLCRALPLRELWVGPDFRLGAGGRGTIPVLEQIGHDLGYTVHRVEPFLLDGQPVTSTLIRQLLADGNNEAAARLLGRPYAIRGEVVHGDHRGRTIGFPTANLAVAPDQLLPADGVYACHVWLDGETEPYPAVTNIGVRPTFGTLQRRIEAHLLDWSGDLYGTMIRVAFVHHLRGEQKFAGIDALVAQIRSDADAARRLLKTSA